MKKNKLSYVYMNKCLNDPIFNIISSVADNRKMPVFVIGGYVRDFYLGRDSKDIDIVTLGSGIELAELVAEKLGNDVKVNVFKNFGTAMLRFGDMEIEFVGARKESYRIDSRKPIVEDGTLEDDQKRRDFTINAMAFCLNSQSFGNLSDPFNGINDLERKIIRTPLEPNTTFSDDPLRMMRAIRFAAQLNFNIEEGTFSAITENKERLKIVSSERIIDEFNKILATPKPSIGINLLSESGLLEVFFPELNNLHGVEEKQGKQHKDNFYHTLEVLDNISLNSDNIWLRWAALLHDIGKPRTKKFSESTGWTFHGHEFLGAKMISGIFRRLKLPMNEKMKYVEKLVLLHLRPIVLSQDEVTDSAVRRLLFDAGNEIDDLMMLCEADITSKNERTVQKHLNNFKIVRTKLIEIEEKDAVRNFQPPVSGEQIMEIFNLKPCQQVGEIKNAIKDAILDGIIQNNFQEAYQFMLKKGEELGLKPVK
ncbi:MAG: HD domain-containing protein [Bacteroidales bacterium]|nr:HD domain-containing protein [Bacteroidales bacterium]